MLAPRNPLPRLDQSGTPLSDQAGGDVTHTAPGHADPLIVQGEDVVSTAPSGSSFFTPASRRTRPRALDLFCGAGGVSMGLHRAGFDVTGVDIKKQPHYPFTFIQADALHPPVNLADFDFVWASPPCQAHTALRKMWNAKQHADLIPETRALLRSGARSWVMENVPGAPLNSVIRLCGTMFDLCTPCGAELRRHRYFETSGVFCLQPQCQHGRRAIGVYGGHVRDRCRTITVTGNTPQQNVVRNRVRQTYSIEDARIAMGIDWMNMSELSQAIPPAYSEFIGRAALREVSPGERRQPLVPASEPPASGISLSDRSAPVLHGSRLPLEHADVSIPEA